MKRFTKGRLTFKDKSAKSDIKQPDAAGSNLGAWPPVKRDNNEYDTDYSIFASSTTDKKSKPSIYQQRISRSWVPIPSEEHPSRSAPRPPISSTASSRQCRNGSVDNLRASARRKLSSLFGGSPRRANHLSASAGAVNAKLEENFLTPYYVRRLLAEDERRITSASLSQSNIPGAIGSDHTGSVRARLAEPEPSLSEGSDIDAKPDLISDREITDPLVISEEGTEAVQDTAVGLKSQHSGSNAAATATSPQPSKSAEPSKSKRSRNKTGGFFGVFRRRIEAVIPTSTEIGGKRRASNSSRTSDSGEMSALKAAFYNVAVFGMAACCVLGAFAAYYLFQDFVKPALWAVICGIILYPLKRRVTSAVRAWLDRLSVTGTPLVVGVVALPLSITDGWGEVLLDAITNNLTTVLIMLAAFPSSALLLHFETIPWVLVTTKQALLIIDQAMGVFGALWVPAALLSYIFYVCLCHVLGFLRSRILCNPSVSWTIWTCGLLHICSYFGHLKTLLFSVAFILCATYYTPLIHGLPSPARLLPVRREQSQKRRSGLVTAKRVKSTQFGIFRRKSPNQTAPERASFDDVASMDPEKAVERFEGPTATNVQPEGQTSSVGSESNTYLRRLLIACFFVYVSLHLWMMLLLTIPIGVALSRRLAIVFDLHNLALHQWSRLRSALADDKNLILPPPLVHFLRVLVHIDRQIIYYLRQSMDFVGSLTAMLLLVIGVVLMACLISYQLYHESIHLIHISADIANQTLTENPTLQNWLQENMQVRSVTELAEQVSRKTLAFVRSWLSEQVHQIVQDDEERAKLLETQIGSMLDTLYDKWWNLDQTNFTTSALQQQKTAIAQWADTWTAIGEGGTELSIDWSVLDSFQEYLSAASSVADSVWLIIKNNMEVLLAAVTRVGSTLAASGSAVINFFLDSIVFLTFLLNVLSESDEEYKPMKMIHELIPGGHDTASTITEQIEEAVHGVFFATSKIAIFYGMLTWLTHTLFAVNIVFIPSVLAALFAAIPFFGAYLVAIPAVLELWLVRGEPFLAVLLFLLHYIPSYAVDDAVYSEITLTTPLLSGMAIAGGIIWWGLEGAIFGPLVLCFILVLGGVYKKICFETMAVQSALSTPASGVSRTGSVVMDTTA